MRRLQRNFAKWKECGGRLGEQAGQEWYPHFSGEGDLEAEHSCRLESLPQKDRVTVVDVAEAQATLSSQQGSWWVGQGQTLDFPPGQ